MQELLEFTYTLRANLQQLVCGASGGIVAVPMRQMRITPLFFQLNFIEMPHGEILFNSTGHCVVRDGGFPSTALR